MDKSSKSNKIKKVILCSGKVYFDLLEAREKLQKDDVVLYRIEQLYPFPAKTLANILKRYSKAEFIWCQEESENMGAWSFFESILRKLLNQEIIYAGRDASASPATGSRAIHLLEQTKLIEEAFTL